MRRNSTTSASRLARGWARGTPPRPEPGGALPVRRQHGLRDHLRRQFNAQPEAFQKSLEQFLEPWLARHDDVYGLGRTASAVKRTIEARRAALARNPLTLPDGSKLTPGGYDGGLVSALYWVGTYPTIGAELSILERYATATPTQRRSLIGWFGPYHSDEVDRTFLTVSCRDTANPTPQQLLPEVARAS